MSRSYDARKKNIKRYQKNPNKARVYFIKDGHRWRVTENMDNGFPDEPDSLVFKNDKGEVAVE